MITASPFQDRYHIRFQDRKTTMTLDKILSELLALHVANITPDHPDYHATVQQWLQRTLTERLGETVPNGSSISQQARKYAIEAVARPELIEALWEWRLQGNE